MHRMTPPLNPQVSRRHFLHASAALTVASLARVPLTHAAPSPAALPEASPARLPRWRGFNLLEKFSKRPEGNPPFRERDLEWIAEAGFNFVRLPMSYLCWTDPQDWLTLREGELQHIDAMVEWGRQYGVHVNVNFHRAPGYCVNPPPEPLDLWKDEKALEACAFHWAHFARRYKSIPNSRVSFDLLNEPADIPEETYIRVVERLVQAIRSEDPDRLIVADGLRWGNKPVLSLARLKVAQSTRGYQPMQISHYKASWVRGSDQWPEPSWPLVLGEGQVWDKERLRRAQIEPWQELERQGVGVHVGEWGAFSHTPHKVVLAWMRDYLELWREAGWGWALWNFRGTFGLIDSRRNDAAYDDWRGHKLDRAMLELLQAF